MFLVTKYLILMFIFSAIIKHWSTSFANLTRFWTDDVQSVNYTFRILFVDLKTIFLTVTLYYVRGFFGIIRTFSLMYQIMLEGCNFSRDVSYNNYLSRLFPFLFTFHILTHNFYKNCTCMSTRMHHCYFKRILLYQ